MRLRLFGVLLFLSCWFGFKEVWASGFNLRSIGSVSTEGRQISHWWYTNSNPTFIGEATAGTEVAISIDGTDTKVITDSNGRWSYTSGTLNNGDHIISMSNNGMTMNFTLTIGNENINWDEVNKGTSETLPTAGVVIPTVMLVTGGLGLVLGARKITKEN